MFGPIINGPLVYLRSAGLPATMSCHVSWPPLALSAEIHIMAGKFPSKEYLDQDFHKLMSQFCVPNVLGGEQNKSFPCVGCGFMVCYRSS